MLVCECIPEVMSPCTEEDREQDDTPGERAPGELWADGKKRLPVRFRQSVTDRPRENVQNDEDDYAGRYTSDKAASKRVGQVGQFEMADVIPHIRSHAADGECGEVERHRTQSAQR